MVEFILSISLALTVAVSGGGLLAAYWQRVQCAHQVFEVAHARLVGRPLSWTSSLSVFVEENSNEVRVRARCGNAREEVVLKRLETDDSIGD